MPIHSEKSLTVPYNFSNLPKNLKDESDKKYEKYLDNHLSSLDEINHKFSLSNYFKTWFNNQKSYHKDIKTNDGFFEKIKNTIELDMKSSVLACGFLINPFIFTSGCTGGSDLETTASPNRTDTLQNFLISGKVTGTAGQCYNEIACSVATASGNINMGSYNDSGGAPSGKEAQTGSISSPSTSSYTFQAVTQWTLTTNDNWLAIVSDNGTFAVNGQTISNGSKDRVFTFNTTLPDPYTPSYTQSNVPRMKIGYS